MNAYIYLSSTIFTVLMFVTLLFHSRLVGEENHEMSLLRRIMLYGIVSFILYGTYIYLLYVNEIAVLSGLEYNVPFALYYGLYVASYVALSLAAFSVGDYTQCIYDDGDKAYRIIRIILFAVTIVLALAAILGCRTKLFTYQAENGMYMDGYIDMLWAIPQFGMIAYILVKGLIYYFDGKHFAKRERYFPVLVYCVMIFTFSFAQIVLYPAPLAPVGCGLGALYLYVSFISAMISKDELTHLDNKRRLFKDMDNLMKNQPMSSWGVILVDLDKFKAINNKYGREEGNSLLKDIADLLITSSKDRPAWVYHYGADKFVVVHRLQPGISTKEELEHYCDIVRELVRTYNEEQHHEYEISLSFGYTEHLSSSDTIPEILERADESLYNAKYDKYETEYL